MAESARGSEGATSTEIVVLIVVHQVNERRRGAWKVGPGLGAGSMLSARGRGRVVHSEVDDVGGAGVSEKATVAAVEGRRAVVQSLSARIGVMVWTRLPNVVVILCQIDNLSVGSWRHGAGRRHCARPAHRSCDFHLNKLVSKGHFVRVQSTKTKAALPVPLQLSCASDFGN